MQWQYQALLPYLEEGPLKENVKNMEKDPIALAQYLSQTPRGNAMVRTTTAPTMAQASQRPNVLPLQAQATVNFRLNPDTSCKDLMAHCEKAIGNSSVEKTMLRGEEPSRITPIDSDAYRQLCRTIQALRPDCIPVPVPVLGATDSRKFVPFARIFSALRRCTRRAGIRCTGSTKRCRWILLQEGVVLCIVDTTPQCLKTIEFPKTNCKENRGNQEFVEIIFHFIYNKENS
ncbi:MAG: peptidase dimerization domain-containing protein [Christensenellales bacterium]